MSHSVTIWRNVNVASFFAPIMRLNYDLKYWFMMCRDPTTDHYGLLVAGGRAGPRTALFLDMTEWVVVVVVVVMLYSARCGGWLGVCRRTGLGQAGHINMKLHSHPLLFKLILFHVIGSGQMAACRMVVLGETAVLLGGWDTGGRPLVGVESYSFYTGDCCSCHKVVLVEFCYREHFLIKFYFNVIIFATWIGSKVYWLIKNHFLILISHCPFHLCLFLSSSFFFFLLSHVFFLPPPSPFYWIGT